MRKTLPYIVYAILLFLVGGFIFKDDMAIAPTEEITDTIQETKPPSESTNLTDAKDTELAHTNRLELLNKDNKSIKQDLADKRKSISSYDEACVQEIYFASIWLRINEAINSSIASEKKIGLENKHLVEKLQIRLFPKMRIAVAEHIRQVVWESDVDVSLSGSSKTTLTLSGSLFILNKNKSQIYSVIEKTLYEFRFKQVRFQWYNGADEYTYWDVSSQKDIEKVDAR